MIGETSGEMLGQMLDETFGEMEKWHCYCDLKSLFIAENSLNNN